MPKLDSETKEHCTEAFNNGYKWYLNQQEADGSLGTPPTDEATFYNTLYVFAVGGRWTEAQRFIEWAGKNVIDGDNTLKVDHNGIFGTRAIYFKGWHIFGAHTCSMFDMSLKTIDSLLTYQDKRTGGFYISKRGADSGHGLVELNTTGMGGLACLITGRIKEAIAAGDFHVNLMNTQPTLPKGLYGYVDPKTRQIITSMSLSDIDDIYAVKQAEEKSDIDKYLFFYDNESDEIQAYANLGVPLAFLCFLYEATGNVSYRDAAMKMFEFFDYAGDIVWIKGQSTKLLWGLVKLHKITEDDRVLNAISKMCNHFYTTQADCGAWTANIAFDDFASQPKWVSICLAGDILLSLAAVLRYMG